MQVGVSFRTESDDVEKLDRIALHIFRQNRAGALRLLLLEAIEKYIPRVEELEQGVPRSMTSSTTTEAQPLTFHTTIKAQEPKVFQANYEATENWGPPKACPVCDAIRSSDGLDQPALAIIKSGNDWGTWACHECHSDGKWYRNKPYTIISDAFATIGLTPSQNDNT